MLRGSNLTPSDGPEQRELKPSDELVAAHRCLQAHGMVEQRLDPPGVLTSTHDGVRLRLSLETPFDMTADHRCRGPRRGVHNDVSGAPIHSPVFPAILDMISLSSNCSAAWLSFLAQQLPFSTRLHYTDSLPQDTSHANCHRRSRPTRSPLTRLRRQPGGTKERGRRASPTILPGPVGYAGRFVFPTPFPTSGSRNSSNSSGRISATSRGQRGCRRRGRRS